MEDYFKKKLLEKLEAQEVKNLMITPADSNGLKFNVRLTFEREGKVVSFRQIAEYICLYAFADDSSKVNSYDIVVTEKGLNGITNKASLDRPMEEGAQI